MTITTRRYALIFTALLLIFSGGVALGWVISQRYSPKPVAGAIDTHVVAEDEVWTRRALEQIKADLALDDSQMKALEPKLRTIGREIAKERDRALVVMQMKLLQLHDDIEPELRPEQKKRLAESRDRLRQYIVEKNPQFFKEKPVIPTDRPPPSAE
jgi:hypothetical protein